MFDAYLVNRMFEISRNVTATKIRSASLRVATLIFAVKQAVPVTFTDFPQALTVQIHLEIVKMQWICITVEIIMCNFQLQVAAILNHSHTYISLSNANNNMLVLAIMSNNASFLNLAINQNMM